jgi:hypothetical protein
LDPSSAPKPPRVAPIVFFEALVYPLTMAVLSTVIWNFIGAPAFDAATVPFFGVLAGYLIAAQVFLVIGLQLGYGFARRSLAEQEDYGRAASAYIEAIADELEDPNVSACEPADPPARPGGFG